MQIVGIAGCISPEYKIDKMKTLMMTNVVVFTLLLFSVDVISQTIADSTIRPQKKYQARAPQTQPLGSGAFGKSEQTTLHWLGMSGFLINSRGTTFMVDPVLDEFDMPLLIDFPISSKDVPHLDAVFITHADNDHFSIPTNVKMSKVVDVFHSTVYVDSLMKNLQLKSIGHNIGETFAFKDITVKLTPADHAYQNAYPSMSNRRFKNEDACGFWFNTPDGSIWATGDSRLLPEHLTMQAPDAILFDFSDSEWHFTFAGAVKLANIYPNAQLLLCHWGSVDSPDMAPFNGDPEKLFDVIINPERIKILAPGEPFVLKRLK